MDQATEKPPRTRNSYWRRERDQEIFILVDQREIPTEGTQLQMKNMATGRLHWATEAALDKNYVYVGDSLLELFDAAAGRPWETRAADDVEEVEDE